MAISDQFSNLNFREPWTLPVLPKLFVLVFLFAAIIGVAYGALFQGQLEELAAGEQREKQLKDEYKQKKAQSVNLKAYQDQLREIDTTFGTLLKQLPNKSQMESLLVEINQSGLGRGLQFELFKPAPQETMHDFYAELPISLKLLGKYHDMGAFAADIAQLSRIVLLNDVALSVSKDGQTLTMDSTARTFRYLDDDELAAQRKAKEAAAKAAKK